MSYIIVDDISKTFKVAKRNSGLKSALKSFIKREYSIVEAVKNVSFEIDEGEIVGYIGPNGAGKSTTIKMLSGILLPTAGNITVDGLNPFEDRKNYVSNIGVVFGQRSQLAWDIPAEDTFDLLKDIYKLDNEKYQNTKAELIKLLNIEEVIKKPVRSLSLGQRMRCEIAASLLHKPKILFLDEPTIGLDAASKKIVRDFILKINKERKVTVILTTHDMTDIETLAKRIILIGKGQILYDGSLNKLKSKYGSYKSITVNTKEKISKPRLQGIINSKKIEDGYNFVIDSNIITVSSFINYLSKKYSIDDIEIDNEHIDDVILKLYQSYEI
jgi:ABC-2 type transport system ATP-binding protein